MKEQNSKKYIYITFFSILLVMFGMRLNSTGKYLINNVHAEDSEDSEDENREESNDDEERDSDDRDEEDSDERDSNHSDNNDDRDEENTKPSITNTRYQNTNIRETQKENDKNEKDDNDDNEEKTLISTVNNVDGTVTKTYQKTDDGKVITIAYTYDSTGKLINIVELNPDGTIKREDEKEDNDEDNNETEQEEDEFEVVFVPNLDGSTNPALSNIVKAKLEQEIKLNEELGTTINKIELKVMTDQGTIKYEGNVTNTEKFLGLFNIDIAKDITIDPTTGRILSIEQSFWSKVLDFFSF